jgi:hypothetical protein
MERTWAAWRMILADTVWFGMEGIRGSRREMKGYGRRLIPQIIRISPRERKALPEVNP